MKKEIVDLLLQLKENPNLENVDHICLYEKIYSEFMNGNKLLEPIVVFFINGFVDLPSLKEKNVWNNDKFDEARKDFVDSHDKLVKLVNQVLKNI